MSFFPHVLHVIDSLAPGGAERMAVEIANACNLRSRRALFTRKGKLA